MRVFPSPGARLLAFGLFLAALSLWASPDASAQFIGVTNSAVGIPENGGTYEQHIYLSTAPTGTVTVSIEVRDTSIATVDVATLTFTPQNYNDPQTVTITAVDDSVANRGGGRRTMVDLTASGGGYDGITHAITVRTLDDDLQESTDRLLEGTSLTYRLRYTLDGVTDTAHIDLNSLTPGVISVSPSTLTWAGAQSGQFRFFTVTALDNQEMGDGYGRISLTIRHIGPSASTPPVTPDWAWTVTDDETPELLVSLSGPVATVGSTRYAAAHEGGETGFTLRLAARPTGPVTVTVGGAEGTDLSLDRTVLSFTRANWDKPQKVTISARHDDDMRHDFKTLTLAASGGGYDSETAEVPTVVVDDDTAGLVISKEELRFVEGGSASYTVALKARPTGPVTVAVGGTSGTDLTLDRASLTFTRENWHRPQTVMVTAGADTDTADDMATLTHTATGGGYDAATADVAVNVVDSGKPGLVLSKSALTVAEGGRDTYTVRLAQQPTANVTVTITTETNDQTYYATEMTPDPAVLTFTMTDWDRPQKVTVAAGEDDDANDGEATLTHTAANGGYDSVSATLTATEADKDAPGILVSPSPLIMAEGGSAGFTVRLASQPSANVRITIGGMAGTDLTLDKDILTFTTTDWKTLQTVTATAAQDEDRRDDGVTLAFAAFAGSSDAYTDLLERLAVTVEDDDAPRVVSLSAPRYEAVEGETLEVRVNLSEARAVDTIVPVRIASRPGDTATSGADYNGNVRTVTIPASGTSAIASIPIMADKLKDPNETFAVTIPEAEVPDGVVLGAPRMAVVTIRERVSGVTPPATATVGYAGADSTIRLTVPTGLQGHGVDVAFRYFTEHGTARGGLDCRDRDADLVDRAVTGTGTPGEVVNGPVVRRVQNLDADTVELKIELCPGSRGKTFDVLWDTSNYIGDPDRGFPGIDSAPFNAEATHCRSGNLCWTRVTIKGGNTQEAACVSSGLEADVRRYAGEAHNGDAHVDRWKQVLAAFGDDNGYTPMTAAEAQQNADQFQANRWNPVVTALQCLEAVPAAQDASVQTGPEIAVSGGGDIIEGADAVFTVHADRAPASDLTVTLTVEDDATSDFLAEGNEGTLMVTIQAGQSSATLTLATEDDGVDEPDGAVRVTLDAGTGYTVAAGQAAGTVGGARR